MSVILPNAQALDVCDDLVVDREKNKLLIVVAFNAIRLPTDASFPFVLGKLCTFVQLVGGIRKVNARIDVVRASTGEVIYSSGPRLLDFPDRRTTLTFCLRLRSFVFPEPGEYRVELFCENQFLDDRPIQVLV